MSTTDTSTAYNLGCNQGKSDAGVSPHRNSEVVIDFGGEDDNSGDTRLINGVYAKVSDIEAAAVQFADGYWVCTGSDSTSVMQLGVGTSNSWVGSYQPSYSSGQSWANIVKSVQNTVNANGWESQVDVIGASDIEPGFSSYSAAYNWIQGYTSVDPAHYLDYGSADGCSTTSNNPHGGCNNSWIMDNVWWVSWGAAPALAIPEIYCSAQASQWTEIALDGVQYHGGSVWYDGPWDQYDLDYNTNTSNQAWSQFWGDLNNQSSTAQTPKYSAEIHWENGATNQSTQGC
ncbi:MAG TPA: hypothetical protein VF725_04290 [Ktedonobacterales bacterium]